MSTNYKADDNTRDLSAGCGVSELAQQHENTDGYEGDRGDSLHPFERNKIT